MIKAVRGMKDLLPAEAARWYAIEQQARQVFQCYGFQELRLPLLERTELFARSIGESTDIVEKEMYTFMDRHGDSLTLRPEATASVVRAFIENHLDQGAGVKKYFTIGPMFRYERPQKGRYRQFHQINCEAFGEDAPELDAELILMLMDMLDKFGLGQVRLVVNSLGCPGCRPGFKEELTAFLAHRAGELCPDCQRRVSSNPLRVFDCKSKACQQIVTAAPILLEHLCLECRGHLDRVLELLDSFGVAFEMNPRLVRGLDYYTRTAFEVLTTQLGAQDAVAGGGRYNGLVKALGGPDLPALGFAIGQERLAALITDFRRFAEPHPQLFIAALGAAARSRGFQLLQEFRKLGWAAEMDFTDRSLKAQMTIADRRKADYVLILGDRELAAGQAPLRQMASGDQEIISLDDVVPTLTTQVALKKGA
ncbi:MAG: histidine--tRNA ligase [Deltaproteobacteria bacterium]|nr:histidine--tRNA ligase [Deltaproteobacteria bacterium]MBW1951974.1 histidine--tRNA ligase [Deltaproteobacteria bacterium]MBW1987241.1 histidine--tRNA ligase [Deltaproteobacteria bacterium]MBW2134277.1 histidine--tRNA ligase [Deltaproteobacteria bacterium]